jgi:predicted nucleotidyltransferase
MLPPSDEGLATIAATTLSRVPLALPVAAYLRDVIAVCEAANGQIVSLVLFGSAATGGYAGQTSDVDLLLVVRDDVDAAFRGHLRDQVAKLERMHGLAKPRDTRASTLAGAITAALTSFADRVTANVRAFFICTRADLLSGDPARIFDIPRRQAQFVDRGAIPSIVASGRTIWGEPLLDRVPLPPIRRMDVAKAFFGLFNQVLFSAAMYPLLPRATKYAMDALKRSVHNCYFCHHARMAPLATEVAFFEERYGRDRVLERLLVLRKEYRPSFGFVLSCLAALVRLHRRTALDLPFPRATR